MKPFVVSFALVLLLSESLYFSHECYALERRNYIKQRLVLKVNGGREGHVDE